jgi:hypothetical protein
MDAHNESGSVAGSLLSAGTLPEHTAYRDGTQPGRMLNSVVAVECGGGRVRTNDGNRTDVIYYGLLPAGTPIANVGGCESSGVSTGPNGQQITMAHEIGHGAGLAHGPCGTPGDANYPAYEPYDPANTPMASLGEYGLILTTVLYIRPRKRTMSLWAGLISLYQYARLINNNRLNPRSSVEGNGVRQCWSIRSYGLGNIYRIRLLGTSSRRSRMKAERIISIIGLMDEDRRCRYRVSCAYLVACRA